MRNAGTYSGPAAVRRIAERMAILGVLTIVGAATAIAAVTFTSQHRDVTAFATLDPVDGQTLFCSDNEASDEGGAFERSSGCEVGEPGNRAVASAKQRSTIQPGLFTAEGSFQAFAEIDESAEFAEGFGGTRLFSDFVVDEPTEIRIQGSLQAEGNGTANLVFRLDGGQILFYRSISRSSEPIDEWYPLSPGPYEVNATIGGFGQALEGGGGESAGGSFSLMVDFMLPAALDAAGSEGALRDLPRITPNPLRGNATIIPAARAGAPHGALIILDLAGRSVRRFAHVPAEGVFWDATDDAGRPLPAGVYIIRDPAGGTAKAMVLR